MTVAVFDNKLLREKPHMSPRMPVWLLWSIVLSIAGNVAALAYVIMQWRDDVLWLAVEEPAQINHDGAASLQSLSLQQVMVELHALSDEALVEALDDMTLGANGYRKQELALALLRTRGYQVEDPLRPFHAWPQTLTPFSFDTADGKSVTTGLFSALSLQEIAAVKEYIASTAVPFTAEGILRRFAQCPDPAIWKAALLRTDEWVHFQRVLSLQEDELLGLAQDPSFFTSVVEWSKTHPDQTSAAPFLVSLVTDSSSPTLADLLAFAYGDYLVQHADDAVLCRLFSSFSPRSEPGLRLAMRLLATQRKPLVWHAAQGFLARATDTPALATMTREQVLTAFQKLVAPQKPSVAPPPRPVQQPPSPKPTSQVVEVSKRVATRQLKPYRTYVIKKGDTLWSVAKRFGVDVEKLKYLNGLKGTTLTPGKELRIPH